MTATWTGVICGVGIFSVIRAHVCRHTKGTIAWSSIVWLVVLSIHLSQPIEMSRSLFILVECGTFIFRLILLYNCIKRIPDSFPRHLKVLILFTYAITYLNLITLYFSWIRCTEDVQCSMMQLDTIWTYIRLNRMFVHTLYIVSILTLDICFVVSFYCYIYKHKGGLKVLLYCRNKFHLILQTLFILSLAGYWYSIVNQIHANLHDDQLFSTPLSSLYMDTMLLLSFLEFGTILNEVTIQSTPDPTKCKLVQVHEANFRLSVGKRNILKFIHHQLRNDVQKMTFMVDSIRKDLSDQRIMDASNKIQNFTHIVNCITAIVEDINIVDSLHTHLELHSRVFDIAHSLTKEIHFVSETCLPTDRTRLEIEMPQSLYVEGVPDRFRQVIRILSEIFFVPSGSENNVLKIRLTENGDFMAHGKSSKTLMIQWDDKELETGEDFFGLAMMIVKRLVLLMSGTVSIQDNGKSFHLSIPFKLVLNVHSVSFDQQLIHFPKRMLVVDDSAIGRKLLIKIIRSVANDGASIQIDEAENGAMALDMFNKLPKYDVIWMDVVMPVVDGLTAYREIRKLDAEIQIVLVTANSHDCIPNDLKGARFIRKPVKKNDVLTVLLEIARV
jgi:two-component system, chemotaxis family, chemotaxis protein CheY